MPVLVRRNLKLILSSVKNGIGRGREERRGEGKREEEGRRGKKRVGE